MRIWKPGPAASATGPVVVSLTSFRVNRLHDLPRVLLLGMWLRQGWKEMQGAVGLWLYSEFPYRQAGSLSVWEDEQDLRRFIRSPRHVPIMRKYRSRGALHSATWRMDRFIPTEAWSEAARRLAAFQRDAV